LYCHHEENDAPPFCARSFPRLTFCGDRHITFEREQAVWIANLDGTGEKKIADGIFPAISPDGTRVAFNTTEKTSDTTYTRHIAVVDVATGKIDVFKDVPGDNSYYPSWTGDGKQILFTTRPHEVWDLAVVDSDGTNFHVPGTASGSTTTTFFFSVAPSAKRKIRFIECPRMGKI